MMARIWGVIVEIHVHRYVIYSGGRIDWFGVVTDSMWKNKEERGVTPWCLVFWVNRWWCQYLSKQILKEEQVWEEKSLSSVLDMLCLSHREPYKRRIRSGAQKRGLNWRCQFDIYGLLGGNQSLLNKITYTHCEEKKLKNQALRSL